MFNKSYTPSSPVVKVIVQNGGTYVVEFLNDKYWLVVPLANPKNAKQVAHSQAAVDAAIEAIEADSKPASAAPTKRVGEYYDRKNTSIANGVYLFERKHGSAPTLIKLNNLADEDFDNYLGIPVVYTEACPSGKMHLSCPAMAK